MQLVRSPVKSVVEPLISMRAARPEWLPVGASLHLDYANNRGFTLGSGIALPTSLITFTRATTRTRINSAGALETVAINTPAIDYDPVTRACRGLSIWEARTNLLLQSQFASGWAATNATLSGTGTAPDGSSSAKVLNDSSAGSAGYVYQGVSVTNTTVYAISVYAKPVGWTSIYVHNFTQVGGCAFTLTGNGSASAPTGTFSSASIAAVGNGWYRCTVLFTANATASCNFGFSTNDNVFTGDAFYIWGAQLEAGSSASPYIPTTTAQVTRAADVAVISGANFSNFYNQTEFSMVAKFKGHASGTRTYFSVSNGTANERIELQSVAGTLTLNVVDGGVTQATLALGSVVTGTDYTVASGWAANDFAASINGGAIVTDGAGTLPTPDRCHIGADYAGANRENTTTAYLTGYPTRLTNAALVALAT